MTSSRLQEFADNKLFRDAPPVFLDEAHDLLAIHSFDAGDVILDEGAPSDCLYLVADGNVRISKFGRGGEQETLSFIGAGDFFGEMALLDQRPASARATAASRARLGRLDRAGLERLLQAAPVVLSTNLLHEVTDRLRKTDAHFIREVMEAERLSLVGSMASTIIHDFKNPMSAILGAAELIGEFSGDPQCLKMVEIIRRSVDRMLGMTQELLDFSRGDSTLELRPVAIDRLMAELDEQALHRLPARDVRVEKRVSYTGELVIDRDRFVRALLNIIKNAAEAMEEKGGVLTVRADGRGADVVFGIQDTGCGIPEDLLSTIFEPFVTRGKAGGTGLGMAIVKSVVDAHNGGITVESTPGEGTRFEIVVPRDGVES